MKTTGFIAILFFAFTASAVVGRLDPHGREDLDLKSVSNLKDFNQCTVCHQQGQGKLVVKPGTAEACLNCHNKSPHSGAADHMGKTFNGQKVSCVSCHGPHRATGMMKLNCTGCHKW